MADTNAADAADALDDMLNNYPLPAGGRRSVGLRNTYDALSDEAKAAFNGNDLKAIADLGAEGLAKLKAVVCKDDATKGLTCPGAICDFVVDHDGVKKDAEILAQFKNRFARLTGVTGLNIIQSATPKSTATRRRLGVSGRTSE